MAPFHGEGAAINAISGDHYGTTTKCGCAARIRCAKCGGVGCREFASLPRAREDGHTPTPRKSDPTPARDGGGAFRSPHRNGKSHEWFLFAQGGDDGPANGTAPQSEESDHPAVRSAAARLGEAARRSLLLSPQAHRPGRSRALGPLAGLSRQRPPKRPSPSNPSDPAADPNPGQTTLPRREGSVIFTARPESLTGDINPPTCHPTAPEKPSSTEQNRRSHTVSAALGSPDTTVAIKPKPVTPPRPGDPDALACRPRLSELLRGSNRKHPLDLNFLCITRI